MPGKLIYGNVFIGLAIPQDTIKLITELYDDIKHIKNTKPSNLHLTLRFLGKLSEQEIARIAQAISDLQFNSFNIKINSAVFWPPNVIVLETELNNQIKELKQLIDQTLLNQLGIPIEDRLFRPHITLARTKAKIDKTIVNNYLANFNPTLSKSFLVDAVHLYQSAREEGKQGDYVILKTIFSRNTN